ncbi:diacylglycerol lipase-beta [Megalopta genalis]|uniref:diacylglycerol lipase-beta n=1 Tax=Megalopta genalis TaxID=115081 RepID=UPI0014433DBE|nr:sn1-specific diacylglycerol lipase beta-like [Megalopta genalis]
MPAIKLFGRKWLAATDDLVYPGLFEIFIRTVWFILIGTACVRYYQYTWNCRLGGDLVRVFLLGQVTYLLLTVVFMLLIVRHSMKGSIMETQARKYVEPLLTVKILLLLPEIAWNVIGSIWMFGGNVECEYDHYTTTVVQALVLFDWILIGLTIFGLALIFDPLGSIENKNLENLAEHSKMSSIWLRRFKFLWWMRKDESANETFQQIAGLLSTLFRGTDLVPSDVLAGCILLRIRRKREIHDLRRLNLFVSPVTTADASVIFVNTPSWMSLESAYHYIKLSTACYGWLYVLYKHTCTGCFRVLQNLTCCSCFRRKRTAIIGDNCCYCYLAGLKYLSDLPVDDILYASFKNHLCEIPFCVVVDHKTNNIVIVIRGSLSVRDILTDIDAGSEFFECEGLPPGSMAHRGMIIGAKVILKQLKEHKILERAFNTHPNYDLMVTGHSLGAGIGILLAFLLRSQYPNVKVYAFATPAGLLSREVARISEEFVFTIGVGDDFVMRLSVDSIENLRTSLVMTLQACRLPKYRVVLNGLGYMLFGIPEKDLNKTWSSCNVITTSAGQSPLLSDRDAITAQDDIKYDRDITRRRFSKVRLYVGGKILHVTKIKPEAKESEGKSKKEISKEKKYEMRWAQPEEFRELIVMPRMLLDHLPESIEQAMKTLIKQQNDLPYYFDP